MEHDTYPDAYIHQILSEVKTIAVVGASLKLSRASNLVTHYLLDKGYDVIPVNPGYVGSKIGSATIVKSLDVIERPIDMVDIFRNSQAALEVTRQAITLKPLPKVIWMQLGVYNEEAARLAEEAGIKMIMNRCPKIEYARLF